MAKILATGSYTISQLSDGAKGTDGVSPTVTSTTITYQNSTNGTTPPTGTWNATANPVAGQYVWAKTDILYSDGKHVITYAVAYVGTNGVQGPKGDPGTPGTNGAKGDSGIIASNTAPANPPLNQIWLNTTTDPAVQSRWNGTKWVLNMIAADNILGSSITGDKIAANTITGTNIKAGTITANNVQTGTLTAAQMAAHTLTADVIDATNLHVTSANIDGKLTADQVDTTSIHIGSNQVDVPVQSVDDDGNTVISYQSASDILTKQQQQLDVQVNSLPLQIKNVQNTLSNQFNDAIGALNNNVDRINSFVDITDGVATFGNSSNDLTLTLDNDSMQFNHDGTAVAYFTENTLAITDIDASLQLGNFAFQPRLNGNLSFTWIGN